MVRALRFGFAIWLAAFGAIAAAQPPAGSASGYYVNRHGDRIELRHARAVMVDEAASGRAQHVELHVLLTETAAPTDWFGPNGISTSVVELAERGGLRGVLLEFEGRNRDELRVRELDRPRDDFDPSGRSMDAEGLWREFSLGSTRIAGRLESRGDEMQSRGNPEAAFAFDAPLDYDPVVRILAGDEARDSEFVRTAVTVHEALLRGDLDAALRLSTRAIAARQVPNRPLNAAERQFLEELVAAIRTPTRIVVRQRRATLVVGDESGHLWLDFALEDGQWRVD